MGKWESENWRKTIELRVLKPVLDAVRCVAPVIEGVTFDLQNEAVVIDSPTLLASQDWKRIQDIARKTIRSITHCNSPIRIVQPRRPYLAYTFHGPSDTIRKHIREFEGITEFTLDLSAIDSLAEAYAELIKRSKASDLVVGFALGGLPAMNFVTVSEFNVSRSVLDPSERLNEMQEKYHLFPGLQWEMTPESPQQVLTAWMDSVGGRKSALFFDTGTDGSGVRQIAAILSKYVVDRENSPFSRITVLGIVDGKRKAQRSVELELRDRSGALVLLDIAYLHVRNVITEDCKALAGYESIRSAGIIQPYSTSVVLHIHDERQTTTTVATPSSGALMNYLINKKIEVLRQGRMEDSELHNLIVGAYLLFGDRERDLGELRKAVELGLLPKQHYRTALRSLCAKYDRKFENERGMRKKGKLRKND